MKKIFQIILFLLVTTGFAQDSSDKTTTENYLLKIMSDFKKEGKVSNNPVVVINERVIARETLDTLTISPFEIELLSVIEKNQKTLIKVYGEQSLNGVILIEKKPFKERFQDEYETNEHVLFLIDRKPVSSAVATKINPDKIKNIEVIKNKDSIMEYTSGNIEVIIKVTLKQQN